MVDRVYKSAWPALRKALLALKSEFSTIEPTTDWIKLRIDPLLRHLERLEKTVRSWEGARLRGAVPMLHSDLVYFRKNVKGLKRVLSSEQRLSRRRRTSR